MLKTYRATGNLQDKGWEKFPFGELAGLINPHALHACREICETMGRNDAGREGDDATRIVHGGLLEAPLAALSLMNNEGQARSSSSSVNTPERISNVNVPEVSNNVMVLPHHNAVQLHTSVKFLSPLIFTSRDSMIRWVIAAHVSPEDHACKMTALKNPRDPWRKDIAELNCVRNRSSICVIS